MSEPQYLDAASGKPAVVEMGPNTQCRMEIVNHLKAQVGDAERLIGEINSKGRLVLEHCYKELKPIEALQYARALIFFYNNTEGREDPIDTMPLAAVIPF